MTSVTAALRSSAALASRYDVLSTLGDTSFAAKVSELARGLNPGHDRLQDQFRPLLDRIAASQSITDSLRMDGLSSFLAHSGHELDDWQRAESGLWLRRSPEEVVAVFIAVVFLLLLFGAYLSEANRTHTAIVLADRVHLAFDAAQGLGLTAAAYTGTLWFLRALTRISHRGE